MPTYGMPNPWSPPLKRKIATYSLGRSPIEWPGRMSATLGHPLNGRPYNSGLNMLELLSDCGIYVIP